MHHDVLTHGIRRGSILRIQNSSARIMSQFEGDQLHGLLMENLAVTQLVTKFPLFYRNEGSLTSPMNLVHIFRC